MLRTLLALLLALLAGIAPAGAQTSRPDLFVYSAVPAAPQHDEGTPARLNLAGLETLMPGDLVDFRTPDGRVFTLTFDRLERAKSGNVSWFGHLNAGNQLYRTVIVWGQGGFGHVATPAGDFKLETIRSDVRLIDVTRSGRTQTPMGDDIIQPPPPLTPIPLPQGARPGTAAAAPTGTATIDVLLLYSAPLEAKLGAENVRTRLEFLIAYANQAFTDSQVSIQYRLVHSQMVNYAETNNLNTALNDLQNGTGAFAGVAQMRTAYGADLVGFLKQSDSRVDPSSCGLGVLNGANGTPQDAQSTFSVLADGKDVAPGSNGFCGDHTLAHEFGHNMGLEHDRANATGQGVFPYSFGYGIAGVFGDIMSYINPTVQKFSNPAINCATNQPCGIVETDPVNAANNALSLNNTRFTIAGFVAPTGLDTTPNTFSFTSLSGVNAGDTLASEYIVVGGLLAADATGNGTATGASAPVSITGGQYSINGGAFTTAAGTVTNGDVVQVRIVAAATAFTTATTTLTIGTLSRSFRVTTGAASVTTQAAIATGRMQSLALRADGTVFGWGKNNNGQVGDGSTTSRNLPVQLGGLASPVGLAGGGDISVALLANGTVWVWGDNSSKQLGTNAGGISNTPRQLTGLANITHIAMGDFNGLARDNSGNVWGWGFIYNTQPTQIAGIAGATQVAVGTNHSLVLLSNGTIRGWGTRTQGQLGDGTALTPPPAGIAPAQSVAVSNISTATAISAAGNHSLALLSDGTVRAWGDNSYGQLGTGNTAASNVPVAVPGLTNVIAIAAGERHSIALLADGTVRAWGDNSFSQLGGNLTVSLTPVAVSGLSQVSRISTSGYHNLALLADGTVRAWGFAQDGQLGDGGVGDGKTPVAVNGSGWVIGNTDMEPAVINITAQNSTALGGTATSANVTLSGLTYQAPISVLGGQYSVNGGAFTSTAGTVVNGDVVQVRTTVPATVNGVASTRLTVGGISSVFVVTAVSGTPGAPTGVSATAGNTSATVNFTAPASNGGSAITGYTVTVSPGGATVTGTASPITVTGLTNGQTYTFTVIATNASGNSIASTASNSVTPGNLPTFQPVLVTGYNLLGNALATNIDVAATFGNTNQPVAGITTLVQSVWKWDATQAKWQFYSPQLTTAANATYAAGKGFAVLSSIGPGEGYWVNASSGLTLPVQTGAAQNWSSTTFAALPSGFNLLAHNASLTPTQFNAAISATPPATGTVPTTNFRSLWAWDTTQAAWYFYAPSIESTSGLAGVKTFANTNYRLHFQDAGKLLGPGVGFWVDKF